MSITSRGVVLRRAFKLLRALNGDGLTIKEIAYELGVSYRGAVRYVRAMEQCGFVLERGADSRLRIGEAK